jgi:PPM family protein phosphatase
VANKEDCQMPTAASDLLRPPQIRYGVAEHQGHRRRLHCDAAAVAATEHTTALVVADGIGDTSDAADAAQLAAHTAAVAGAINGTATVGLHAARGALVQRYWMDGPPGQRDDCVLVVAACRRSSVALAWSGDARAWRQGPPGILVQLTSDHTQAARLHAAGVPWTQAVTGRHRVTATATAGAVGTCLVDLDQTGPQRLLLASDGLYKELSDRKISDVLALAEHPEAAAADLVAAALAAGGRDNVAVIVADLPAPDEQGALAS